LVVFMFLEYNLNISHFMLSVNYPLLVKRAREVRTILIISFPYSLSPYNLQERLE
jgi:hypothetical protein